MELCWSRDGLSWQQHPERPTFLANGLDRPQTRYDWDQVFVCHGIIERGDGVHDGNWLKGWNFQHMTTLTGDQTDASIDWQARSNFNELKNESIRLHFWIENAELFSFWFE